MNQTIGDPQRMEGLLLSSVQAQPMKTIDIFIVS